MNNTLTVTFLIMAMVVNIISLLYLKNLCHEIKKLEEECQELFKNK